jgi:hypothetical protein
MGVSFTIGAGPRQSSHSQVRLRRGSWPHFTVSDSRLPSPLGPSSRIYILQEEGCPAVTPGIGFPFRHLLRLARLRWRYSNPPPYGIQLRQLRSSIASRYIASAQKEYNTLPPTVALSLHVYLFLSNGPLFWCVDARLLCYCLATNDVPVAAETCLVAIS